MFLDKTIQQNHELIDAAVQMHQAGMILPDTFIVDTDQFFENARVMLETAKKENIHLYYMLKQIGRNPYLAEKLERMGYDGAVVVDFKEAQVAMKHHLHISHAGHLVQMPEAFLKEIISYGCDYMTVYSAEKLDSISRTAESLGRIQKIMVRVIGEDDLIYSGQTAGFYLSELPALIQHAASLKNIVIAGVDSFPCFLYDAAKNDIAPQKNLETVLRAKEIFEQNGITIENVNAPSATCTRTLRMMKDYPIDSAEPGHGLSGTTPLHAAVNCEEKPCVVYLSEVSHNLNGKAYVYGGGYYRRGHMNNAAVGTESSCLQRTEVTPPALDSIDYHFELDRQFPVGTAVIMAFRFQIFVTRSDVCLVEGIHSGNPSIVGLYSSLGEEKR